jgi:hypothetical protein
MSLSNPITEKLQVLVLWDKFEKLTKPALHKTFFWYIHKFLQVKQHFTSVKGQKTEAKLFSAQTITSRGTVDLQPLGSLLTSAGTMMAGFFFSSSHFLILQI